MIIGLFDSGAGCKYWDTLIGSDIPCLGGIMETRVYVIVSENKNGLSIWMKK